MENEENLQTPKTNITVLLRFSQTRFFSSPSFSANVFFFFFFSGQLIREIIVKFLSKFHNFPCGMRQYSDKFKRNMFVITDF